jgi:hypothetical protein
MILSGKENECCGVVGMSHHQRKQALNNKKSYNTIFWNSMINGEVKGRNITVNGIHYASLLRKNCMMSL